MSALLKRAWQVNVDSFQTSALRVVFHVTKTLLKEPNTMTLKVYNLSDASRSKLKDKGAAVSLEAGYLNRDLGTNTRAVIFSGTARLVPDHMHEGPEWETKVYCGDGEQVFQNQRIVKSFAAASGAKLKDVIKFVAQQMTLNLGNLTDALNAGGVPFETFEHGIALNGNASDVFNQLMKTAGYVWSVQQGALVVVKPGEAVTEEIVILSKATGLIGSPEHTPPHHTKKPSFLTAKCLLNPKIRPGYLVRMDSLNVKGDFIVQKVIHSGDSHGSGPTSWTTHFEALASTQPTTNVGG